MSKKFAITSSLIFIIMVVAIVVMKISIKLNDKTSAHTYLVENNMNIYEKHYDYMNSKQTLYFDMRKDFESLNIDLEIGAKEGEVLFEIYNNENELMYTLKSNDDGTSNIESTSIPYDTRYKVVLDINKAEDVNIKIEWSGKEIE